MDVYQEETGSSFTHDGVLYDLNLLLQLTAGMAAVDQPVKDLKWVLTYCIPKDEARVLRADLSVPVLIAWSRTHRKFAVIDGLHRLQKAVDTKRTGLPSILVSQSLLNQCRKDQT